MGNKIKVEKRLVVLHGDEMAQVAFERLLEQFLHKYLDIDLVGIDLTAETRLKSLERNLKAQNRELKRLEDRMSRRERGRTVKRLAGSSLLVVGAALLFNPLSEAMTGAGPSATAGVVTALLGSLLLLRA